MVALEAFREPIVLIAGGSSKNLSFAEVGRRIARRAKAVVLFGATAPEIERAIRAGGAPTPPIHPAKSLEEAVRLAHRIARPGEVTLLSPASASFDMFRNYAERGQKFREFVRSLSLDLARD
jgi:UDP-N-acetylmuramoylalanine--D-glutamate ligase